MQSYDQNPTLRLIMQQMLQNNQGGPQYPGQAIANTGAQLANALMLRNEIKKGEKRDANYASDIAAARGPQPVDSVAITPAIKRSIYDAEGNVLSEAPSGQRQIEERYSSGQYDQPTEKDLLSKLLSTGNPDVTRDVT